MPQILRNKGSPKLRILILEDNPDDLELIQYGLKEAGFTFTAKCVDSKEGFEKALKQFFPDLILSDYDLPSYDGATALAYAKSMFPDVPFILVTGAVGEDRAIEMLTSGAKDYVLKNRLTRLGPAVQRALAEKEEREARMNMQAALREANRTLEKRIKLRTADLEREIEERKQTEEELRRSEQRERERVEEMAALLDALPIPVIIVHDPDSRRITGNQAAHELLRHPRASEISLSGSSGRKPRHFKAVKDGRELRPDELPAQRAARGEQVWDFEFSLVFNDGSIRDVLNYGTPLRDDRGHPRGAVHVLVDITERKLAEEESEARRKDAEEQRARLQAIMDALPVGAWVADAGGKIIMVNDAAAGIFGGKAPLAESIPDYSIHKLWRPATGERIPVEEHPLARTLKGEIIRDMVMDHERFDGARGSVMAYASPIRDPQGGIVGGVVIGLDITARMRAEREAQQLSGRLGVEIADLKKMHEELEVTSRELESFTYSVSHGLRAPLRAIHGSLRTLRKTADGKLDKEERRKLDVIQNNAAKTNQLIDSLLVLSRVGRLKVKPATVDMKKLVKSAWNRQLQADPDTPFLKIENLPNAFGDRGLLFQVFSNLIGNAVKYTRKRNKPEIKIGGKSNGNENIYYVSDNGVGFNMKHRERLFEAFRRLHPESRYEGTGVGLAIAQRIIYRHGGRMWAEGKIGKGATFYFSLPAQSSS